MRKFLVFALVLALAFAFAGCAQKAVVQPEQQATTQKAVEPEKKIEPAEIAAKEEPKKAETVQVKEVAEAKAPGSENIYFDYDKYNIRNDAKPTLTAVSDWLIKNKQSRMLIEGHCDERGTGEYNLALGERRAKSTRDYLVSLGVTKNRLDTVSYGKEKPLCKEHNEDCWQKNRRAQFVVKTNAGGAAK